MQAKRKTRKNRKYVYAPIRWTLTQAASEFGINPRTVTKRAKAAGIVAGKDGKFSTTDIHDSICGDYERDRTRKMKEDADAKAISNAKERVMLVDKTDL